MAKKGVPEWLNSSLWSSTSPSSTIDDRLRRHPPATSLPIIERPPLLAVTTAPAPPLPVPPPSKYEINDLQNGGGNDVSPTETPAASSVEDVSRRVQVVAEDTEVLEQIDRDVMRTHPDMHFFSGDSAVAKSNQDALKNALIIFAKLNPGSIYVQGMNEILAPIFYIFKNDPDKGNAAYAESDAFFCFVELMSGFRDNFCQQLDNSVVGIRYTIRRLSLLLKHHDEELWHHLEVTTKMDHALIDSRVQLRGEPSHLGHTFKRPRRSSGDATTDLLCNADSSSKAFACWRY